ncbi:hypothetical protein ACM39_16800 [Chryseobacterium sp. FH2]|nr:hypothetical protein ACM39_16800 [Chryseobacterium sp. FH2]
MKYVSLRKSKIILFLLFCTICSAQYKVIAKIDLDLDKIKDIVYKDPVNNRFIFEYKKSDIGKKVDSIFFFSNYNDEAGIINLKIVRNIIIFKFTYAPKYLDYDLLSFTYDKVKRDWFLLNLSSYRTNPLNERLLTEKCQYKIPKKINFSLKKNNFDDVQENLFNNREYLIKCSKINLE